MIFPAPERLDTHRAKFCTGSAVHRKLLEDQAEGTAAIAGGLDKDAVSSLAAHLAALGGDVDKLSVRQLRDKVVVEASRREERRAAAAAAAERAAARLAQQKTKAEVQQQIVGARLAAQLDVTKDS